MKFVPLIAIVVCTFAAGWSIKNESVFQKPAPSQTVVYSDAPAPGSTTTVYTPSR